MAVPPSNAEAVNKNALRVDRRSCSNLSCKSWRVVWNSSFMMAKSYVGMGLRVGRD